MTMTASASATAPSWTGKWRPLLVLAASVAAMALYAVLASPDANAKAPILFFSSGPSGTQAGSHPNVVTTVEVGNTVTQYPIPPCACDAPRDVTVHTPAGVIANPHVVSECEPTQLQEFRCPTDAQVGLVLLRTSINTSYIIMPLFRTTVSEGQAGRFVFQAPLSGSVPQYLVVSSRTGGDYGLDIKTTGINRTLPVEWLTTIFWGVPADPSHDLLRWAPAGIDNFGAGCNGGNPLVSVLKDELPPGCFTFNTTSVKTPAPSSLPTRPFISSPTTCAGPLTSIVDSKAYDNELDHAESVWPETTGCDLLSFNPSLSGSPTTSESDSPSGLEIDLKVPQTQDAKTLSPSEIKGASIELPPGLTINPSAADGKVSCSDAQAHLIDEGPGECPDFAKIGTVSVDSSALPGPISGAMYLGDPKPGNTYRTVLTASGFGTNVKFIGTVKPNPQTGQLVASFQELPQAPFQELNIHLFGSERGLLATPTQCGTYPVKTTFTPWASQLSDQTATQFFAIESGPNGTPCPGAQRPFAPQMEAGTVDNTAGLHSAFSFDLRRVDGEQNLAGLSVVAPPGFTATLRGVQYCPESAIAQVQESSYTGQAELAHPACPAASEVGTSVAGVGAGTHQLYVNGKAYLAGPYKGAPLSLVIVTPAVSGPYDLGNVVVRAAIHIDPATAQVTAVSDPLPQIREGIPLRVRSLRVNLDRPDFALNPTNCDPFATLATLTGDQGASISRSAHFQVANCTGLPFEPSVSLRLSGGLARLGHPAIHSVLRGAPGEANIHDVTVTLPKGEQLDNGHIGAPCVTADFEAGTCPTSSLIGTAEATSPLLDQPLEGNVYTRASRIHKLPDLAIDLKGQVDIELTGRVDAVNGRLRTSFESTPDVPVSSFTLDLVGGAKGLLVNEDALCGTNKKATARMIGQNGKVVRRSIALQKACRGSSRGKRHHQKKAGR
jgi:hypothetical protein